MRVARPLAYKKRVRLPPESLDPTPQRPRRRATSVFGVLGYCALASGTWALGTDRIPVERWLDQVLRPTPAMAATRPPPRPVTPPPVQPAAAPAPPPAVALEAAFPAPKTLDVMASDWDDEASLTEEHPPQPAAEPAPPAATPGLALRPRSAETPPIDRSPAEPAPRSHDAPPRAKVEPPAREPAPPVDGPAVSASGGMSCEAAQASHSEQIVIGAKRAPDLPREALSRVLNGPGVLAGCGVADSMSVQICAAITGGRAVGVTVTTRPGSSRVAACVAKNVRRLSFPSSPHLDVTHTRF